MKQKLNIIIKGSIFLISAALIWNTVTSVLQKRKVAMWDTQAMSQIYLHPNYYDVIISGTSMAMTNLNPEELYLKYGIASISIGQPEQIPFLSYYALEETLKNQSPKVVLFDVQSLFYTEDKIKEIINESEDYFVHYTLDEMKNNQNKYNAVKEVNKYKKDSTLWSYFSKMYYTHGNWESLSKDNFKDVTNSNTIIAGSPVVFGNLDNCNGTTEREENNNEKECISEINIEYIKKMKDLCDANGSKLIFIRSCGSYIWTWAEYNAVKDIAEKLQVPYLDMAFYEENIEFNWDTDTNDGKHHNIVGAKKWTDFIGDYIAKNYDFIDRRQDESYFEYEDEKEKYYKSLTAMKQKIQLSCALNLNQYLDTLYMMEKEDLSIILAVNDDAASNISDFTITQLQSLGLKKSLRNKWQNSYIAVWEDGKLKCEKIGTKEIEYSDTFMNGLSYSVRSGGLKSEKTASIIIDNSERIQGGRGLNIVVYNKFINEVISSVYFDTCKEEKPATSRIVEQKISQKETDINQWLNFED